MVKMNDEKLREKVLNVLKEDTRVDEKEIDLRVEAGVVYMEGAVDSAAERRAAREDVETVPGVESIVDYLTLKNYIPRDDDELRESVRQDLMRDPYVDQSRVEVTADRGEVRLEGRLATYAEKTSAEDVAWWSPGVINVISNLEVDEELPTER